MKKKSNKGRERVVDKPKLTLFERILELKKEIIDTNKPVNKVTQSVKECRG